MIDEHLNALQAGRAYVQIHTQLTSPTWSFSLEDGVLFAAHPSLRTMLVVGVDGTRYLLSRRATSAGTDPLSMDRLWRREAVRLLPAFRRRVAAGALSRTDAESSLRDAIWRTVSARLRLRYDRLEP